MVDPWLGDIDGKDKRNYPDYWSIKSLETHNTFGLGTDQNC